VAFGGSAGSVKDVAVATGGAVDDGPPVSLPSAALDISLLMISSFL
jgi:hypothetical protein